MTKILSDSGWGTCYFIDDKDGFRQKFDYAMNGNMMFVPKTAKWVEITTVPFKDGRPDYEKNPSMHGQAYRDMRRTSLVHDPKLISRWLGVKMQEAGATPMEVKSAGLDLWWVGKSDRALGFADALHKVASDYAIPVEDALGVLKDAQIYGRSSASVLDSKRLRLVKEAVDKMAQAPMDPSMQQQMPPPPPPQMPQQMPGMDPNMAGMQPPPPPALSPTDLAISEAVQGLQQQNQMQMQQNQSQMEMLQQQMQMQQQSTQQLVSVLQGIQQRAQQISGATGGQIPEGAAGAPAMAAQALAPPPQAGEEPPPMPMMAEEPFSAETVANQINPEMVDQAADLQDQGVFDTAAIAMLSGVSALQDTVANYIPNLETALDNLGRVLLTLQMKEPETKEAIGEESFVDLEDTLRSVFKSMGDAILLISHNAQSAKLNAQQSPAAQTANA
jgi:TolA-binding protein